MSSIRTSTPPEAPRLAVCHCERLAAAVLNELVAAGWSTATEPLPARPWSLRDASLVTSASVTGLDQLGEIAEVLSRGVSVVASAGSEQLGAQLFDQCRRLAAAEWFDPDVPPLTAGLDLLHLQLLLGIQQGDDVAAAARRCHVSPRTAARRLAEARSQLGARTTAEAAARVATRVRDLAPH